MGPNTERVAQPLRYFAEPRLKATPPTTEPIVDPESIGSLLDKLGKYQSELDQRIGELVAKLEPIFIPQSADSVVGINSATNASPVAAVLHSRIAQCQYQINTILDISARINL